MGATKKSEGFFCDWKIFGKVILKRVRPTPKHN